jgi:hypothetical protein
VHGPEQGVPLQDINAVLATLARTIRLGTGPYRCDACRERKTTYSVTKNGLRR